MTAPPPNDEGSASSAHYVRAVTDLGDRGSVVAGAAIYTASGVKLVERGARIDSRLYERLVQHKLSEPIDTHLSAANAVDPAELLDRARQLLGEAPLPRLLAQAMGAVPGPGERLLAPLRSMPLPPAVAFKLTVMREQRPQLFVHSLQVALVSVFLGLRSGLTERDCVSVAAAGMLHDIGVLHMNPDWFEPEHHMNGAQRSHLAAHPVTAMVLLRELHAYPPAVERAVLEHHERMDGSGYPRGIAGDAISRIGRILIVAEVAASLYDKYADGMPALRLWLVLRLNAHRFPPDLVNLLLPLLRAQRESLPAGDAPSVAALAGEVHQCMKDVAAALQTWADLQDPAVLAEPSGAHALLAGRIRALERMLFEAGSHPRQQPDLLADQGAVPAPPSAPGEAATAEADEAARTLAEMVLVGRETLWQLRNAVDVSHRRWPQLSDRATPSDCIAADWCDWVAARIGSGRGGSETGAAA
ncbi:HD-GYP domain-containing protein [Xylophilus sp.]|uniref:HD-GYP domain-containing protein n=1 Tax=Xylophilus sp. TaxID=2653893 RepID=UPI0013BC2399|nr:HD domain-containing phosphohydrolase [Xylophilus sp.]KAF1048790.1 MAG: 3'3'-cGAMP-specific phosphodiesterase 3 [Xylophilus sp.]